MTYYHVPPDNITIQLQGRTYTIKCSKDDKPQLMRAVVILENEMKKILQGHQHPSPEQLAILAALNLAVKSDQLQSAPPSREPHQSQELIDDLIKQCQATLEADV